MLSFALIRPLADTQGIGEVLELAVAVTLTGLAVHRMVCDEKFDYGLARVAYIRSVCMNDHSLGHGVAA